MTGRCQSAVKDLDLLQDIQAHVFQEAVPAFSAGYFCDLEMSLYFFIPSLTYLSFRGSDNISIRRAWLCLSKKLQDQGWNYIVTFSQISHMYRHAQMTSDINNDMCVDSNISQRYVCLIYLGQADISWLPGYQRTIMRICLVYIAWWREGRGQMGIMSDTTTWWLA